MRAEKSFLEQIQNGINQSDYLILMISENSLSSKTVIEEWQLKFRRGLNDFDDYVFPFIIDATNHKAMPDFLRGIHSYHYDGNRQRIRDLANDIMFWVAEKNGQN